MNNIHIMFAENYFNKRDVLTCNDSRKLKVLETPHKKWYKKVLQYVTFGLYKAPYQYKVKLL
jgi:hypothetical protein